MSRKSGGRSGEGSWQWSRTAETRRVMLDAAREVFVERGFAESSVAEVVERAGSSVGSLYHHFGGKSELFLALWDDHQKEYESNAASAVAKARAAGEDDPLELFVTGARAFLRGSWERRHLVRLFMDGDAPPGFELLRRTRSRDWIRQNAVLLGAGTGPEDRAVVTVLTTVIGEAAREVAACETAEEAAAVADTALRLIRRLDPLDLARDGG
ncbi:helix-turn-helix domain-containing protein [Spirillospora sp. NPDC029432]|uniref:TetR/AcrR family transcriptional regulator n=1 Tax=Spirillospora sp. NPDC029432 TaxID=3154599 RepID=UPI0034548171